VDLTALQLVALLCNTKSTLGMGTRLRRTASAASSRVCRPPPPGTR